jgi:C_GCAxxG_C_C family probable redox protein
MAQKDKKETVDEAYRLAEGFERKCTGCAQSVVAGLLDALGIEEEGVFRAASGLADGIGLTGDGSCGALAGGCMILSLLFGRERENHEDMLRPMKSYRKCKKLHDDFIDQYGSCRCFDIQEKLMGRTYDMYDPEDLQEAFESGMIETCSGVVGRAASKAAELILYDEEEDDDW